MYESYPDLTYEEYIHAVAHFSSRIESYVNVGLVGIDQLLVNWYLKNILKSDVLNKKKAEYLHKKYLGALQKMIFDGLLLVIDEGYYGKQLLRVLHVNPKFCTYAFWLSLENNFLKNENSQNSINLTLE